ncbi:MAG: hypothetical protein HQL54_14355 [Magnetococcales bacterium]|nr:hypothetical protein [Magnetococcales bacterium]
MINMTIWNVLLVLCFFVLYLGVSLVYFQVRKLRDEMRSQGRSLAQAFQQLHEHQQQMSTMIHLAERSAGSGVDSKQITESVLEGVVGEISALEEKCHGALEGVSGKVMPELQEIRREIRYMEQAPFMGNRSGGHGHISSGKGHGVIDSDPLSMSDGGVAKNDAYESARLLLSNGVDEEQVIDQTGLTVEEVSLLKRLSSPMMDDDEE